MRKALVKDILVPGIESCLSSTIADGFEPEPIQFDFLCGAESYVAYR